MWNPPPDFAGRRVLLVLRSGCAVSELLARASDVVARADTAHVDLVFVIDFRGARWTAGGHAPPMHDVVIDAGADVLRSGRQTIPARASVATRVLHAPASWQRQIADLLGATQYDLMICEPSFDGRLAIRARHADRWLARTSPVPVIWTRPP